LIKKFSELCDLCASAVNILFSELCALSVSAVNNPKLFEA
jgi:hypothetical protein